MQSTFGHKNKPAHLGEDCHLCSRNSPGPVGVEAAWNRGCRSGHGCFQLDVAPGGLNNSFGEWNYTLCFFQNWLSFFCVYLLWRTKNSDPHRNVLSDCGLGPEPRGQCVRLPGARGPGQKRTVPGDQGGACGRSSRQHLVSARSSHGG